jgi:hypothetical protein
VLFAAALPWLELRDLARAIALRYPAADPGPHASLGGQISPPGARHKSGGWRVLSMPPEDAREAVKHPNGPEVWAGLLTEFAAELQQAEAAHARGIDQGVATSAEMDDTGVPWVPRLGGRASLSPELEHVARTGRWDRGAGTIRPELNAKHCRLVDPSRRRQISGVVLIAIPTTGYATPDGPSSGSG